MIKLSRNEINKIITEKQRKSVTTASFPDDLKYTDLVERALNNSKIEAENQNLRGKNGFEEGKRDLEFHEQYFS